jgi:hypothetical protein
MIDSIKQKLTIRGSEEWLVLVGGLVLAAILEGARGPRPFDDAFITFRYARRISEGAGFVYNSGYRVLGTTTPLYTLVLASLAWLTTPDALPWISLVIAIVADAINVWLMFRLARWTFGDSRVALLVATVFLLQPLRLDVSTGGMETSVFVTCILAMYDRYLLANGSLATAAWGSLAFLVRPDAVLALLPLFAHWFVRDWRRALLAGCLSLLLVAPWLIWATWYFGAPIPLSMIAKHAAYDNPPWHAGFLLLTFLSTGTVGPYPWFLQWTPGILIALVVAGVGVWRLTEARPAALTMAAYPWVYAVVMTSVNPAMYFSWYYVPLIPGLLITATAAVWYGLRTTHRMRQVAVAVLATVTLALPTLLFIVSPAWPLSRTREEGFWDACAVLEETVQPSDWILAPDIGVVGWCSRANVLDPIGLVSPEALQYMDDRAPGQLVTLELVMDKQPAYIVALDQFINPYLLDVPAFEASYEVIWQRDVETIRHPQTLYVLQRKDEPGRE